MVKGFYVFKILKLLLDLTSISAVALATSDSFLTVMAKAIDFTTSR